MNFRGCYRVQSYFDYFCGFKWSWRRELESEIKLQGFDTFTGLTLDATYWFILALKACSIAMITHFLGLAWFTRVSARSKD
jgi:hypothetical protein